MSDEEMRAAVAALEKQESDGTISWADAVLLARQRQREFFLEMTCVYLIDTLTPGKRP